MTQEASSDASATQQPTYVTTIPTSRPRLWTNALEERRTRRTARDARRTLERELASYTTPAERLELDAVLARYEPEQVADIQKIVDRYRVA